MDFSSDGRRVTSGVKAKKERVQRLLFSKINEWVTRPLYGVQLEELLVSTEVSPDTVKSRILRAFDEWETGVVVREVLSYVENHVLYVRVQFTIPGTGIDDEIDFSVRGD